MKYSFIEAKLGAEFCQQDVKNIASLIESSTSFTVVGLPSVGVSIFLKYLATLKFAYFVHIDINDLPSLTKSEFLRLLTRGMGARFADEKDQEIVTLCKKQLEILTEKYGRIVLIFNRFDRLKKEFNQNFFANLRSMRDVDKEKVVMIFSSNWPLSHEFPQALVGGNLNMFSKTYYLKPYSNQDLARLIILNSPKIGYSNNLKKALALSGGHYQLLQLLLKSDDLVASPLSDDAVKLQLKELFGYLHYTQQKQLEKIALGKSLKSVDQFLINIGIIKKEKRLYQLFSDLFAEYIKLNSRPSLSQKEMRLYKLLKVNKDKIVSKDEIISTVWHEQEEEVSDWALNSLIYRLKRNQSFGTKFTIESHKKTGYRLIRK